MVPPILIAPPEVQAPVEEAHAELEDDDEQDLNVEEAVEAACDGCKSKTSARAQMQGGQHI